MTGPVELHPVPLVEGLPSFRPDCGFGHEVDGGLHIGGTTAASPCREDGRWLVLILTTDPDQGVVRCAHHAVTLLSAAIQLADRIEAQRV